MESSKLELADTVDNIDSVIDNVEAICSRLIEAISEALNLPFECQGLAQPLLEYIFLAGVKSIKKNCNG